LWIIAGRCLSLYHEQNSKASRDDHDAGEVQGRFTRSAIRSGISAIPPAYAEFSAFVERQVHRYDHLVLPEQ
jgi:hypothetical protein